MFGKVQIQNGIPANELTENCQRYDFILIFLLKYLRDSI